VQGEGDGQTRVNSYHHPERYLIPDENFDTRGNDDHDQGERGVEPH